MWQLSVTPEIISTTQMCFYYDVRITAPHLKQTDIIHTNPFLEYNLTLVLKVFKLQSKAKSNMPSFRKRVLSPNSVFDKEALKEFCKDHEIKEIHINKIHRLMLKNPNMAFADIPGLPKQAAQLLQSNFVPLTSTLKSHSTSIDKKTTKLLIELQDGNMIETVIIRHSDTRSEGHNVVCVSSQIGCKMGCTFCATGTLGLIGNLRAAEILEQIAHARFIVEKEMEANAVSNGKKRKKNKKAAVRNIVFMGMFYCYSLFLEFSTEIVL